ncbi:MAG: SDR family NAD(P)-dependent oxidoreductase [Rhizonema sp. PD38]|nr:SDR family NAD(P)-dependent oxidoreductase [Rhizonema sp. PD38]
MNQSKLIDKSAIAIIGMVGRFPGAKNLDEFWHNLQNGIESVSRFSDQELLSTGIDPNLLNQPNYVKANAVLSDVELFDASFFGFTPKEAALTDPQYRIFLECAWEAIESAGYDLETYGGAIGVYAGSFIGTYLLNNLYSNFDTSVIQHFPTRWQERFASIPDTLTTRVSYKLNLNGPSLNVQTACSTSLVAVDLAVKSLQKGECDMALAGGISIRIPQKIGYLYQQGMAFSSDGHCRSFDAKANGTIYGDGVGIVVLKRLKEAVADGDCIHAIIRSSTINNDGFTKTSFTAPSADGQAAVISKAHELAGMDLETITYIEAHGTGTTLGDPVEIEGLAKAFRTKTQKNGFCAIGSVKTNIGHLVQASGVAGLIKTVLALKHKLIPPSLHFEQPLPNIDFANSPFYVNTKLSEWKTNGTPRRAGVNSFGVGGTNAHVILEEAPSENDEQKVTEEINPSFQRPLHLLTLSAKTEKALQELAQRYQEFLHQNPTITLANACFTANTGRTHFNYRLAVVSESIVQLLEQLGAFAAGEERIGLVSKQVSSQKSSKIAFLFTGQGSQHINMGRQLYETQPTFRKCLERCDEILYSYLEKPLLEILYPQSEETSPINETAYTQSALFALEYALFQLWKSWGIEPDVVMGHSVGEYVAAVSAGVFSLEDGLRLIAARGRLMQALPPEGKMVSLLASEAQVLAAIQPYTEVVAIAAVNGQESIVISGRCQAIENVCATLEAQGVKIKTLQVSHAFHSPLMEPMLAEFAQVAKTIAYSEPQIKLISNITGKQATSEIATPEYWCGHVVQPIKFAASMETLYQQGYEVFVEIGPKPILLGMGRQCIPQTELEANLSRLWLPSLRQDQQDWQQILQTLAEIHVRGVKVDWSGFDRDYARRKVVLPTYPFQRQRYWIEPTAKHLIPSLETESSEQQHCLLGKRLRLPFSQEIRFESQFSLESPTYLNDHKLYGIVVVPVASHISMVLSAVKEVFGTEHCEIEDLWIPQPLVISDKHISQLVQLILMPQSGETSFKLISLKEKEDPNEPLAWMIHATGKVRLSSQEREFSQTNAVRRQEIQQRGGSEIPGEQFYSIFAQIGYNWESSFKWIKTIWRGEDEALGKMQPPPLPDEAFNTYLLYPGLIDSCFQLLACCSLEERINSDSIYVPFQITSFKFYKSPSSLTQLWAYARKRNQDSSNDRSLIGDISLFDEQGQLIAEISGHQSQKASRQVLLRSLQQENFGDWLYEFTWQSKVKESTLEPLLTEEPGSWLIFADSVGLGLKLVELLKDRGADCVLVYPGSTYERTDEEHYRINPSNSEEFQHLLKDITGEHRPCYRGIVHLWSLEENQGNSLNALQNAQVLGCASVLHLVQAIVKAGWSDRPRLWLVTQGTQAIATVSVPLQVQQASLWGLGRVITMEHPELHCTCLDLPPSVEANEHHSLLEELWFPDLENQIAYRQGIRYVARLVRRAAPKVGVAKLLPSQNPLQVRISSYGSLDNLTLVPMQRQSPSRGEVEIQVCAAGLNFRDVLNALGMLKEYYAKHLGISSGADMTFGFECAGKIVAVGEDIESYQVGDKVMAVMVHHNALGSFVTLPAALVVPQPENLCFEEAATLPQAFLTAHYGLNHLVKLKSGDRVLIHAAAGGVGQAAVQLAQRAGAEVFATASPSKWEFLKSIGVKHIMNSRTLDFADEIMDITGGQGVDVVFNSLNGDFITKSFEVLGKNGRFVEIGKIGIWNHLQVLQFRPDVSYFPFDLGEVKRQNPKLISSMFWELMHEFKQGRLKPLPYKVFPASEVANAFRYMAGAKHIGKIVISIPEVAKGVDPQQVAIQENGSYLITGGLGALGLKVAQWMAEQGARHLVLMSRHGVTPEAQEVLTQLEQARVQVKIAKADVSNLEDVSCIIEEIKTSMPPLRGVVHAAGVLDDGVLLQLDWERFTGVMAPKVAGTWNLHTLTRNLPLNFFVCFSSITALLGSRGQGNYAAANAFMDALVHSRRQVGLPGLSINWGSWADGGMAASLASRQQIRRAARGISMIPQDLGLQVLGNLIKQDAIQVAVLRLDWLKFLQQFPNGAYPSLFSDLAQKVQQLETGSQQHSKQSELLHQLNEATWEKRLDILIDYLIQQVKKVIGLNSIKEIALEQPLNELGFDSLALVEFRTLLESSLKLMLPAKMLLENPTIVELAQKLAEQLITEESSKSTISSTKKATIENLAVELPQDQKLKASSNSALVEIQPSGSKHPFFCVPGLTGSALSLYRLAFNLDSDQPFYGLQTPGLYNKPKLYSRIEDLAAHYIEVLQTVQPHGPYLIGGHSFGSIVALEMVRQMQIQDRLVALLAIFDAPAPHPNQAIKVNYDDTQYMIKFANSFEHFYGKKQEVSYNDLALLPLDKQLNYLVERLKISKAVPLGTKIEHIGNLLQVYKANLQAIAHYLPPQQAYPTRIALFQTREPQPIISTGWFTNEIVTEPNLGWSHFSNEPVEHYFVPGNHITMMVEPNVKILAKYLQVSLRDHL